MNDIEASTEARAIAVYEAVHSDATKRTPWPRLTPGDWDKWRRAANVAQQPNTQEPALYQSRIRPAWKDDADWLAWETCSKESAEDYERTPLLHDWQYQVRRLYAEPAHGVKP